MDQTKFSFEELEALKKVTYDGELPMCRIDACDRVKSDGRLFHTVNIHTNMYETFFVLMEEVLEAVRVDLTKRGHKKDFYNNMDIFVQNLIAAYLSGGDACD